MECYFGYVETVLDALLIFEACRIEILQRTHRRLTDHERNAIRSGSVFVWDEDATGIHRWTDGRSWSSSRARGNFLTYRELDDPLSSVSMGLDENPSKSSSQMAQNGFPSPPSSLSSSSSSSSTKGAAYFDPASATSSGRRLQMKRHGLTKRALSLSTADGRKYHLISYYNASDVVAGRLKIPRNDARISMIKIPDLLYPELVCEISADGKTTWRFANTQGRGHASAIRLHSPQKEVTPHVSHAAPLSKHEQAYTTPAKDSDAHNAFSGMFAPVQNPTRHPLPLRQPVQSTEYLPSLAQLHQHHYDTGIIPRASLSPNAGTAKYGAPTPVSAIDFSTRSISLGQRERLNVNGAYGPISPEYRRKSQDYDYFSAPSTSKTAWVSQPNTAISVSSPISPAITGALPTPVNSLDRFALQRQPKECDDTYFPAVPSHASRQLYSSTAEYTHGKMVVSHEPFMARTTSIAERRRYSETKAPSLCVETSLNVHQLAITSASPTRSIVPKNYIAQEQANYKPLWRRNQVQSELHPYHTSNRKRRSTLSHGTGAATGPASYVDASRHRFPSPPEWFATPTTTAAAAATATATATATSQQHTLPVDLPPPSNCHCHECKSWPQTTWSSGHLSA
ncbi:Gti1/Pac2 family-domain-containing protein [Syncephalis fuscata]|nr:Gti1/Pac2 family-domain-containing protein [Syncephalis fuscata]